MSFTIKSNHGTLEITKDFPKVMTKDQAILFSIEKWKAIAQFVESGAYPRDGGLPTCALCVKFHFDDTIPCSACPIMEATGLPTCDGTPYDDYNVARDDHNRTGMLEAAYAEIQFLLELLSHGEYIVHLGHGPLKASIRVKRAYSKEDALAQIETAFMHDVGDIYRFIGVKVSLDVDFDHKRIDLTDVEKV